MRSAVRMLLTPYYCQDDTLAPLIIRGKVDTGAGMVAAIVPYLAKEKAFTYLPLRCGCRQVMIHHEKKAG